MFECDELTRVAEEQSTVRSASRNRVSDPLCAPSPLFESRARRPYYSHPIRVSLVQRSLPMHRLVSIIEKKDVPSFHT